MQSGQAQSDSDKSKLLGAIQAARQKIGIGKLWEAEKVFRNISTEQLALLDNDELGRYYLSRAACLESLKQPLAALSCLERSNAVHPWEFTECALIRLRYNLAHATKMKPLPCNSSKSILFNGNIGVYFLDADKKESAFWFNSLLGHEKEYPELFYRLYQANYVERPDVALFYAEKFVLFAKSRKDKALNNYDFSAVGGLMAKSIVPPMIKQKGYLSKKQIETVKVFSENANDTVSFQSALISTTDSGKIRPEAALRVLNLLPSNDNFGLMERRCLYNLQCGHPKIAKANAEFIAGKSPSADSLTMAAAVCFEAGLDDAAIQWMAKINEPRAWKCQWSYGKARIYSNQGMERAAKGLLDQALKCCSAADLNERRRILKARYILALKVGGPDAMQAEGIDSEGFVDAVLAGINISQDPVTYMQSFPQRMRPYLVQRLNGLTAEIARQKHASSAVYLARAEVYLLLGDRQKTIVDLERIAPDQRTFSWYLLKIACVDSRVEKAKILEHALVSKELDEDAHESF